MAGCVVIGNPALFPKENFPVQETCGENPGCSCLSLEPAASSLHHKHPNANQNNHNNHPSVREKRALEEEEDGEAGEKAGLGRTG